MINNSPFDNHIKGEFEHYSPDVPAHIWQNIVAKRDKRKPVGFWLSIFSSRVNLGIIGILMLTGGILLFQNIHHVAPDGLNKNNQPANSPKTSAGTINSNNNTASQQNSSTKNSPDLVATAPAISTTPTNGNLTTIDKSNLAAASTAPVIHRATKENNHIPGRVAAERKSTVKNILRQGTGQSGNTVARKNPTQKIRFATTASLSLTTIAGETGTDDYAEPGNSKESLSLTRSLLDIQVADHKKIVNRESLKKPNKPDLNIPCPEAEKNSAGNKKYIEVYGGPDYAFSKFSDTANSTYLQKRKESTSFSSAFSAGIRYTRVFKNGVSIRSGLNYSQINEKFTFVQGNIIQITYITDTNGDTTGSFATNGTRYKTTYNKFRTVDIPLILGYEFGNGRIHTNLNAGAVINVYSWQKGDVLDATYQPVNVTTGKSTSPYQFKTNVGVGFMGAVSFYYKLNERMHLLAEPYFRYNFSPASKAELTLKQKYNTVGLRLGVRVDF